MAKKSNSRRDDGRIAVQVYIGMVDGKRKYKTFYGKTQKEANAKAEEFRNSIGKNADMLDDTTLRFWAEKWCKMRVEETTEERAENSYVKSSMFVKFSPIVERWVDDKEKITTLGDMPMQQIKLYQIQAVLDKLAKCNPHTGKPSAKKTLIEYRKVIQDIYSYARHNQAIDFDPTDALKISKNATESERRALTLEERERICTFEHRAKLPAMLMTFAGLRRGEVTALLWSDIDFESKTITITKSYDFKKNRIKPPKSKAGDRTVPMPDVLCDYLKAYRQSTGKGQMLVVLSSQGKQMTESAWKRLLESYLVQLNYNYGVFHHKKHICAPEKLPLVIEPFTWHCLRHTYATILYDAGVDVLTAKDLLGHKDVKTTLGIYTHLSNEKKQNDISKLNTYLSPNSDKNTSASQMQVNNA